MNMRMRSQSINWKSHLQRREGRKASVKANTHKGVSCNQSIESQTYDFRDDNNPDEPGPSGINTEERKSKDIERSDLNTMPSQDIMDDAEKGQANSSEDPSINASRESLRNAYPRAGQRLQQVLIQSYESTSTICSQGDRPTTTSNVNISIRPATTSKYVRNTATKGPMTPPSDVSVDSYVSSIATFSKNNKVAPEPPPKDNPV